MKTPEPLPMGQLYNLCELAKTSAPGSLVEVKREELWALAEMAKDNAVLHVPDFLRNQDNLREERASEKLFYLQDSRDFIGNNVLWWAKESRGYTTDITTDISKAHVFNKECADSQHDKRETDIPWPKDYIDTKARPTVDMQNINRTEALESAQSGESTDENGNDRPFGE